MAEVETINIGSPRDLCKAKAAFMIDMPTDETPGEPGWRRAQGLCGLFDERQNVKNPSVAAGLERTLAAYMNQGLLLVGLGTTLMMFEETRPNLAGWILVPSGAVHIVWSWLEYYFRMRALRNNKEHRAMNYRRSMVWTAVLVALMLLVVGLNMASNIKYGFVGISLPRTSAEQQTASVTGSP